MTKTKLARFKVYNFRSIEESDWIEIAENSCLVGTNEAGKTNLLIALWKLNPANKEPIVPLDDFPRHLYSNYKAGNHSNDVFIAADFILEEKLQTEFAKELKCDIEQIKRVLVRRRYDGKYYITFPYSKIDSFPTVRIKKALDNFKSSLTQNENFIKELDSLKSSTLDFLSEEINALETELVSKEIVEKIIENINHFIESNFGKKKNLPEFFQSGILKSLEFFINAFDGKEISPSEPRRCIKCNAVVLN